LLGTVARYRSPLEAVVGLGIAVGVLVFVVPPLEVRHERRVKELTAAGVPVDEREARRAAVAFDVAWATFFLAAIATGIAGSDAVLAPWVVSGVLWLFAAQRIIRKPLEWPIIARGWTIRFFARASRPSFKPESGYVRFSVAAVSLVLGIAVLAGGVAGVAYALGLSGPILNV
jgi:hypothetical protein